MRFRKGRKRMGYLIRPVRPVLYVRRFEACLDWQLQHYPL